MNKKDLNDAKEAPARALLLFEMKMKYNTYEVISKMEQLTHKNHFLPQLYLKQWSHDRTKIWQYMLLVSNENVPIIKESSIREVGYQSDLYTCILNGKETDEFEIFMRDEIEEPAKKVIIKIENKEKLSYKDKGVIVRFLAAQYERTPARYFQHKPIYDRLIPQLLDYSLKRTIKESEEAILNNRPIPHRNPPSKWLPYRAEILSNEAEGSRMLKVEVLAGRQIWLLEMDRILNHTYKCLLDQRWEFIEAATGIDFFTSDDPVICLQGTPKGDVFINGGWSIRGTHIIFPITPKYAMYTEIGDDKSMEGMQRSPLVTFLFQRYITNHAFRSIFMTRRFDNIVRCRARCVDETLFEEEKERLRKWPEIQSMAELEFKNLV